MLRTILVKQSSYHFQNLTRKEEVIIFICFNKRKQMQQEIMF